MTCGNYLLFTEELIYCSLNIIIIISFKFIIFSLVKYLLYLIIIDIV